MSPSIRLGLSGLRAIVVEDEALISMLLKDILEELGCRVIGTAARIGAGLELLEKERPDFVLLDVNLQGQTSYPIADILIERKIPFVFMTGYDVIDCGGKYKECPLVHKPVGLKELEELLLKLV